MKTVRLTESDLVRIVNRVISEQSDLFDKDTELLKKLIPDMEEIITLMKSNGFDSGGREVDCHRTYCDYYFTKKTQIKCSPDVNNDDGYIKYNSIGISIRVKNDDNTIISTYLYTSNDCLGKKMTNEGREKEFTTVPKIKNELIKYIDFFNNNSDLYKK